MHPLIIRLLQLWYSTQSLVIRWGSFLSDLFYVSNGTRQGSILSPYLFNCYIDELSVTLQETPSGCFINEVCFNHLLYADDAVLIAPSPGALQKLMDVCQEFSVNNDLIFSPKKSKVMCFNQSADYKYPINCPAFYLNKTKLPLVFEYTYLGVIIRSDGKDKSCMRKAIRSLYGHKGNMIKSKFNACTRSEDVKLKLFQSYCANIYCCSLWASYTAEEYNEVKVCLNNILRYFIKSNRTDSISQHFVMRNLPNVDVIVRKATGSLYQRIMTCENTLVSAVVNSAFFTNCKLFSKWKSTLFILH